MENNNSSISGGDDDSKSNHKVKLMCSYGGRIQPRSHDHQLTYFGGHTKILAVDRRVKFADILAKVISLCNAAADVSFKYQLPGEDLDALVSVVNDDDLEQMMAEYDRIHSASSKPARLRLFLFSPNPPVKTDLYRRKTDFDKDPSSTPLNPDFLFGFDKEYEYDYQQPRSSPKSEIPWGGGGTIGPEIPGLDPRTRSETQPQIQGNAFVGQGLLKCLTALSREGHVITGGYVGAGVAGGPVVYRVPLAVGQQGMQTVRVAPGFIYRDQPVYTFVPAIPTGLENAVGFNTEERRPINGSGLGGGWIANVETDDGVRSEIDNAARVAVPLPTATMAATFFPGAKNNI
ncbi:hypothetical protein U1Q18_012048 [Sarracenia purpurea var. burkii]